MRLILALTLALLTACTASAPPPEPNEPNELVLPYVPPFCASGVLDAFVLTYDIGSPLVRFRCERDGKRVDMIQPLIPVYRWPRWRTPRTSILRIL